MSLPNWIISLAIVVVVGLAVIETEPVFSAGHDRLFGAIELGFGIFFSIEYAARFWAAAENPRYGPGWRGRWRYVLSWTGIFDALAIIASFTTPAGLKPFMLRLLRLLRIFRLAKLSRMSSAMGFLVKALADRRDELLFSLFVGVFFLLLSATCLYFVEGDVQPDKFGSIPRALWWATATLTTIGYGDVYPITPLGKVMAGLCAIAGIGLVAMPTGIMAAAFSEAVQKHLRDRQAAEWRERFDPLLALAGVADDLVQQAVREIGTGKAAGAYLTHGYSGEAFDDLVQALGQVPLYDLRDFQLVKQVAILKRLTTRAKRSLDRMTRDPTEKGVAADQASAFKDVATRIALAHEAISARITDLDKA